MYKLAQETTFSLVIEKINETLHGGHYTHEDTWEWRQLKKDCEKLRDAVPAQGWAALGGVYTLIGDVEKSCHAFETALALDDHPVFWSNYLANLLNVGFYQKAHELYSAVGCPTSGEFSARLDLGITAGAFRKVNEFIRSAEKMGLDMNGLPVSLAKDVATFLEREGLIDDARIARHLEAAGSVLSRHRVFYIGPPEITVHDVPGEFSGVTMALRVPGDESTAFAFNMELAEEEIERSIEKHASFDVIFVPE